MSMPKDNKPKNAFTREDLDMINANQAKLLEKASHKLRTPLTIIRGTTDVALRSKEKNYQEAQQALQTVEEEARKMTKVIDELLFSLKEEQKNIVKPSE
ncbi:sensor histidine kinase [Patescibacteria group bacterium]